MRADRHAGSMEIGDEAFFRSHDVERRTAIRFVDRLQQWSGAAAGALHLPERIASVNAVSRIQEIQRADFCEKNQFAFLQVQEHAG